jgi:hypothetical protein
LNEESLIVTSSYMLSSFEQEGVILGSNVASIGSRVLGKIIANLFGNFIETMVSVTVRFISKDGCIPDKN